MTSPTTTTIADDWHPEEHAGGEAIYAELGRLRGECPMAWTNAKGGSWTVTRHEDITAIARNTAQFSNVPRHPRIGTVFTPPLEADRPVHTTFRRILNQFFTKAYLDAHLTWLPELADAHIDALLAQDEKAEAAGADETAFADWSAQLCVPLPATVLCRLIGMPDSDWTELKQWTETSFRTLRDRDDDPVLFAQTNAKINAYGQGLIDRARATPDGDDIVSALVRDPLTEGLTDEQIFGLVRLLLQAGHTTTAMGMANTLHRLAADPELQSWTRANPDRIGDVVREILRVDTPVLANVRRVTEDLTYAGRDLHADDHVFLSWGSGNRDSDAIADPERIDPDRPAHESLTFGHGIHKCPGQPLALAEITGVMTRLLATTTSFELRGTPIRKRWEANGVQSMRLRVTR